MNGLPRPLPRNRIWQSFCLGTLLALICGLTADGQDARLSTRPDKREFLRRYRANYQKLQKVYRDFTMTALLQMKRTPEEPFDKGHRVFIGRRGDRYLVKTHNDYSVNIVTKRLQLALVKAGENGAEYVLQDWRDHYFGPFMNEVRVDYYLICAPFQYIDLDSLEFLEGDDVELLKVSDLELDGQAVVHVDFLHHINPSHPLGSMYGYVRFLKDHYWALLEWYRTGTEPPSSDRGLVNQVHYDFTDKGPVPVSVVRFNRRAGGRQDNIERHQVQSFSFDPPSLSEFNPSTYGLDWRSSWPQPPLWLLLLLLAVVLLATSFVLRRIQRPRRCYVR